MQQRQKFLSLALFSEEPLAVGKPVGLEKETEQNAPYLKWGAARR
jgi:hypothetical protein